MDWAGKPAFGTFSYISGVSFRIFCYFLSFVVLSSTYPSLQGYVEDESVDSFLFLGYGDMLGFATAAWMTLMRTRMETAVDFFLECVIAFGYWGTGMVVGINHGSCVTGAMCPKCDSNSVVSFFFLFLSLV